MGNYAALKSDIQRDIKQNEENLITGNILQAALLAMINSLGAGFQFAGIATPSTNPGTPDQRLFYLASPGVYVNFGKTVPGGSIGVLYYTTEWNLSSLNISGVVVGQPVSVFWNTGGYISKANGQIISAPLYSYSDLVPVSNVDYFGYFINLLSEGSATCTVAYYDEYEQFIGYLAPEVTYTNYKLTLPAGTKYIRMGKKNDTVQPAGETLVNKILVDTTPTQDSHSLVESGGVYSSINTAINEIIGVLNSNLVGLFTTGVLPVVWNTGGYISKANGSINSNASFSYSNKISVYPFAPVLFAYFINLLTEGSAACSVAYYGDNDLFLGYLDSEIRYVNYKLTLPSDARYIRLCKNNYSVQPSGNTLEYKFLVDETPTIGSDNLIKSGGVYSAIESSNLDLYNSIINTNVILNWIPGHYINVSTGEEVVSYSYSVTDYVPVVMREFFRKYYLTIKTEGSVAAAIAFYDGNKQFISSLPEGLYNDYLLQIPSNAIFAKLCKRDESTQPENYGLRMVVALDEQPTEDSDNLVKSGGVYSEIQSAIGGWGKNYLLYDGIRQNQDLQLTGWVKTGGTLVCNGAGISNLVLINRKYFNTHRKFVVDFELFNGTIYFYSKSSSAANSSLVSVDFTNNTLNLHNHVVNNTISSILESVSFTRSSVGTSYRLVVQSLERGAVSIELYDNTLNTRLAYIQKPFQFQIPAWGLLFDSPAVFASVTGAIVTRFDVIAASYSDSILLQVIGDSITQGYYSTGELINYAGLLAKKLGDTRVVRSGRSGGDQSDVISILQSETAILKPEYVMVAMGTNSGVTQSVFEQIISTIIALGCKPIINHIPSIHGTTQTLAEANAIIDSCINASEQPVLCARMDVATSINYNVASGADPSCFYDSLHPNDTGHGRMFKQILIDIPEIV